MAASYVLRSYLKLILKVDISVLIVCTPLLSVKSVFVHCFPVYLLLLNERSEWRRSMSVVNTLLFPAHDCVAEGFVP